jgi:hypothetical protein
MELRVPPRQPGVTQGVLETIEGERVLLRSGNTDRAYGNYPSAGHVEGKAAIYLRENGSAGGVLYHDNMGGTCGRCNANVPTLLPEGVTLDIVPPVGASATKRGAVPGQKTYTGNEKTPKLNPRRRRG